MSLMQRNCQLFRPAVDDDDADQAMFDIGEVRKDTSSISNTNGSNNISALSPAGVPGEAFVDRRRWGGPHNSDSNDNSNNTSAEALKCFINLSTQQANSKKPDEMQWQKITEYRKAKQQGKQSTTNSARGNNTMDNDDLLPHQAVYGIPLKGLEEEEKDDEDDNSGGVGDNSDGATRHRHRHRHHSPRGGEAEQGQEDSVPQPAGGKPPGGNNSRTEEGGEEDGAANGSVPRRHHKSMDSTNDSAAGEKRSNSRVSNGESPHSSVLTSETKPSRAKHLKPLTAKEHQQHVIRSTLSPPPEDDTPPSTANKRTPESSSERTRLRQGRNGSGVTLEESGGVAAKSGDNRRHTPKQRTSIGSDGIGAELPLTLEGKPSTVWTDPGEVSRKSSRPSVLQGGSDGDEEPNERTEMQW